MSCPMVKIMGSSTALVYELLAVKSKFKGVFSRLYCYYGNLLCKDSDNNVLTNDRAIFDADG